MSTIKSFVFNSFDENTYVLSDETGQCVIIDPGCHLHAEEEELSTYIKGAGLTPMMLLNTHCHIDHILGNGYVSNKYHLFPEYHTLETVVLDSSTYVSQMYGIQLNPSPKARVLLQDGQAVTFGNTTLKVIFTPGHSPGSVSFWNEKEGYLISGDVLFRGSIGRTDLPGGSYEVLMDSIHSRLLPLGDEVRVFSGHGPETTIGDEKRWNPFLREDL